MAFFVPFMSNKDADMIPASERTNEAKLEWLWVWARDADDEYHGGFYDQIHQDLCQTIMGGC